MGATKRLPNRTPFTVYRMCSHLNNIAECIYYIDFIGQFANYLLFPLFGGIFPLELRKLISNCFFPAEKRVNCIRGTIFLHILITKLCDQTS